MSANPNEKSPEQLLKEYQPRGHFAGVSIKAFLPFINGDELDEEGAKAAYSLTDAQLPFLHKELEAAGLFGNVSAKLAAVAKYAEKHDMELAPHEPACKVVGSVSKGEGPATFVWDCVDGCHAKGESLQIEDHRKELEEAAEAAAAAQAQAQVQTQTGRVISEGEAKIEGDTKARGRGKQLRTEPVTPEPRRDDVSGDAAPAEKPQN